MTNFSVSRKLLIEGDVPGDRMHLEQERLRATFPRFGFVRGASDRLAALGTLETNLGSAYGIRIPVPDRYPHRLPDVVAEGWKPTGPHINGAQKLCVMRPGQWKSFYTIAFLVAKTALWVNKYDLYLRDGTWPGQEQSHGLGTLVRDVIDRW